METRDRLLDAAQELIQAGGYNGFSYQHLADRIGIRKASIHHHFPSKADLGREVIRRYRQRLEDWVRAIDARSDFWEAFELYLAPFRRVNQANLVCLCGALAAEFPSLPPEMQLEVRGFFESHQQWLTHLFSLGQQAGAFQLREDPAEAARLCFSSLQGALLVQRSLGESSYLEDVISNLKFVLGGPSR